MEAIRTVISSTVIENIIELPKSFKNHKLEIIILPIEEKKINEDLEIDEEIKSISGVINLKDKNYKEFIAEERIKDYENIR